MSKLDRSLEKQLGNEKLTVNLKEINSARNLSFHSLRPIALYYSYADEDVGLLTLLQRQLVMLNRSGLITVWHRGMIQEGEDEYTEQVRHLNSAHIILLFVSPHFLESERTYSEAVRAMQRLETEGTVVIPIIWRPTADWQRAPFGGLRAFPRTEKALTEYSGVGREKLVKEIATAIRRVVEELREKQF